MTHFEIEAENVVARYETGTLPETERVAFEEHLVDCAECQDAVEREGELRRGLRAVMAAKPARITYWRYLNAAALVLLAVSVAVLAYQLRRANEEVRAARQTAAVHRPAVTPPPAAVVGAALLVTLDRVRGGESPAEPVNQLTLPAEPRVLVFSVDAGEPPFAAYRVTLQSQDGATLAQTPRLTPPSSNALALAVPSSALQAGDYRVVVEGAGGDGAWHPAARYDFRVRAVR